MTWFGQEFAVVGYYLNTASIGVPPVSVVRAVTDSVREWGTGGGRAPQFDGPVAAARDGFARLVGVGADRVAIGSSAAGLVGLVAASLPDGSRVVVAKDEFTSVTFPFAAQVGRGVTVTEVELTDLPSRAAEADLVAVSVVRSADGAVLDLAALRDSTAGTGTRVLLDVTQAAGWMPLALDWADAVVGAGYKWLLSPRGVAWLAVSPGLQDMVVPHAANWYAGQERWASIYGLPLRLATDARRLDTSPAWMCQVGAAVAVPWLASLDREQVRAHCVGLADMVRIALGGERGDSAIVSVDRPGAMERLDAAGVVASTRRGAARLSFYLHNTEDDVDRAVSALLG